MDIEQKYKDKSQSIKVRVEDLLSKMTLEEKVNQLRSDITVPKRGKKENDYTVGHVRNAAHFIHSIKNEDVSASECAELLNKEQEKYIKNNRLGIPVLQNGESLHGVQWGSGTCFPQAIALAATWNEELVYEIAQVIGKELRAVGVRQVFAPVINIARDGRWGRMQETYGEDTYLTSKIGVAFVKGIEGENVVATPKHFASNYGEGGRDSNAVHFSERLLREIYLPAFKACIKEGKARSIMTSYNSLDGIPCSCNKWLLKNVLKKEWDFDGFVITDYGAVNGIYLAHKVAKDRKEAVKKAIIAGVDLETPICDYTLLELVKSGEISESIIDESVRRVLKVKFELGLFDEPFVDTKKANSMVRSKENKEKALKASRESIVLLKNKENILPLSENIKSLALFGEGAKVLTLGGYSGPYGGWRGNGITPYEGICKILGDSSKISVFDDSSTVQEFVSDKDAAIFFVTLLEGEGIDRSNLNLPEKAIEDKNLSNDHAIVVEQRNTNVKIAYGMEKLIKETSKTGTPVIIVLLCGAPVTMENWIDDTNAIILPWYPGEQGGTAIAEVLFGKTNPSGKLPVTFPKNVGQLPLYYSYKPSGRGYSYVDNDGKPLFEFGYGLSYTKFEYSNLIIKENNNQFEILCDITNIGEYDGNEVVQLYIHDEIASTAQPLKVLKGFKKIYLNKGQKKTVTFKLGEEELGIWDEDMNFIVEDGYFTVMIASSSEDIRLTGRFEVLK